MKKQSLRERINVQLEDAAMLWEEARGIQALRAWVFTDFHDHPNRAAVCDMLSKRATEVIDAAKEHVKIVLDMGLPPEDDDPGIDF